MPLRIGRSVSCRTSLRPGRPVATCEAVVVPLRALCAPLHYSHIALPQSNPENLLTGDDSALSPSQFPGESVVRVVAEWVDHFGTRLHSGEMIIECQRFKLPPRAPDEPRLEENIGYA